MSYDVRRKPSAHPIWTIGLVALILATAGMTVWMLKRDRDAETHASSMATPADASTFGAASKTPVGRDAARAGRVGKSGAAGASRGAGAALLPVTAVGADKNPVAIASTPAGDPPIPGTSGAVAEPANEPIYDATNADVSAPKLVTPLVHEVLPTGPNRSGLAGAIEVFVNERGTVDSVKSTIIARTLGDNLFITNALSVAKTWRFEPALKDGHPVKYRLLAPLSMF